MKKKIIAGICAAIMTMGAGLTVSAQEIIEDEEVPASAVSEKSDLEKRIEELEDNGWYYKLYDRSDPDFYGVFGYLEDDVGYGIKWQEGNITDDGWAYWKVKSSEIEDNGDGYFDLPPSKDGDVVVIGSYEGNESNVSIPEQIEGLPVKYIFSTYGGSDLYRYNGDCYGGGSGGGTYFATNSENNTRIFVPDSISCFQGIVKDYGYENEHFVGVVGSNVTFICNPGSAAEKYFIENHVRYELYKEENPDNSNTENSDVSSDTSSEITTDSSAETSSDELLNSVSTAETSSEIQTKKTSASSSTNPNTGAAVSLTAAVILGAGVIIFRKRK